MEEEEFERRCQCKRQLEGAEGGGREEATPEDELGAATGGIGRCSRRTY